MRKWTLLTTLFFFIAGFADEPANPPTPAPVVTAAPPETATPPKPKETGLSSYAKNWIFAGSALALAAIGAVAVAWSSGRDAD
jgi:hypothetical protein